MKKVGILYICTGKYEIFWNTFWENAQKKFLNDCELHFFVFTDSENIKDNGRNLHVYLIEKLGWPFDTLFRFHLFNRFASDLSKMDYLMFMNANIIVNQTILSSEILPDSEELFGVLHPGFYNCPKSVYTFEKNSSSTAFLEENFRQIYFFGAFNGGKTAAFLTMSKILAENIDIDLQNNFIACWHDESHLNKYFNHNLEKIRVLGYEYCYMEECPTPHVPKIIYTDKAKYGGRNFLREISGSGDTSMKFISSYTHVLIKKGKCFPNIGLWDGKMGIAVYLLHLARITGNEIYELQANEFIDTVYGQISDLSPVSYADGLLGIGSGIGYIIEYGFMDGNSDEVLSEIDVITRNVIDSRPMDLLALENGVCGVGYYLYRRLKKKPDNDESMITLKLKEYLIYLIDWVEELLLKTKDKNDYNDVYFLLCRLHKLDVFNHKIERMMSFCLRRLVDLNIPISDRYELLGIESLKILKPWI